jgi:hypothetical protein
MHARTGGTCVVSLDVTFAPRPHEQISLDDLPRAAVSFASLFPSSFMPVKNVNDFNNGSIGGKEDDDSTSLVGSASLFSQNEL